jgi:hypothetical protein
MGAHKNEIFRKLPRGKPLSQVEEAGSPRFIQL